MAHELSSCSPPGLWSTGSIVVVHGLSCSMACGIFLDEGSDRVSCIGRQADSLPLSHQRSGPLTDMNALLWPLGHSASVCAESDKGCLPSASHPLPLTYLAMESTFLTKSSVLASCSLF